eukprot:m.225797 g.225797  ORF g.225797 m.225797 type:complete len:53 (+) comp16792_c0_seq1:396-554(+)
MCATRRCSEHMSNNPLSPLPLSPFVYCSVCVCEQTGHNVLKSSLLFELIHVR